MTKDTKVYTKCGENKPANIIFFPPDKRKINGLSSWCRECYREAYRKYNKKRRKKHAERMQEYRKNNKKEHLAYRIIHGKMRRKMEKPEICMICNEYKDIQLASINHIYTENPKDWLWLCPAYHALFDKLNERGD